MAKINAINNKSGELTIDPGASGDSFIQFNINGTGEFRIGVDDDASDAFKIAQGSALGTTDTFIMTAAGERTMPLQSAFSAYNSTTDSNVTGAGTDYTCDLDSEIFDQNGDFSADTFTAPVTGRYFLTGTVEASGITSSHTAGIAYIKTSNRNYLEEHFDPYVASGGGTKIFTVNCVADMDASDTAIMTFIVDNGSKVVDLIGGVSPISTSLQGFLAV